MHSLSQNFELRPLIHASVLCRVSRLVEVADYNMNIRPRLTWSQIWENMGSHFAKGKYSQPFSLFADAHHLILP